MRKLNYSKTAVGALALGTGILLFFPSCTPEKPKEKSAPATPPAAIQKPDDAVPFSYVENFETNCPVQAWGTDGKYTVAFMGLSEEKAFSGKKSFKLDVTFQSGTWFYWCIPVDIPYEGKLRFSGRILVGEESAGVAGLGLSVICPLTDDSGCEAPQKFGPTKGEWKLIEGAPDAFCGDFANQLSQTYWGLNAGNTFIIIDKIGIFLRGAPGKRVVVYIDDLKIEGEALPKEKWDAEQKKRLASYREVFGQKFSSWKTNLERVKKEIASCSTPETAQVRKTFMQSLAAAGREIQTATQNGFIKRLKMAALQPLMCQVESMPAFLQEAAEGKRKHEHALIYILPAITNVRLLPHSDFVPGFLSDDIKITACAGEYESASFAVSALSDLGALEITPTDLKGANGLIPAKNVDIRIVKCWWVDASGFTYKSGKEALVPELLLKDDALVKVDMERKMNAIKLCYPTGETYAVMQDRNVKSDFLPSTDEFPVKDSPFLKPVDIPKNTHRQFWITVKVPENAAPDDYTGKIILKTSAGPLPELNLSVKVLPFALAKSCLTHSIWYFGSLSPDGKDSISHEGKSEEQYYREIEDLVAHGADNPVFDQPMKDEALVGKALKIRKECGADNSILYCGRLLPGNPSDPEKLERMNKHVSAWLGFLKQQGAKAVYCYGIDEATGEKLLSQRPAWQTVHKIGGLISVAGGAGEFECVGDLLDLFCKPGPLRKDEAERWHKAGHRIFSYANPQGGMEQPETYRRNYGILLWKNKYDGCMTCAYQLGYGRIWDDLDHNIAKDETMAYPTVNGVVDTLQWEGFREGVDDMRYLTTLLKAIEKAKQTRNGEARKIALEAEQYLVALAPEIDDLNEVRTKIIGYILRLKP